MALVRENILEIENLINDIKEGALYITENLDSANSNLNNDSNYQIFVQGTDIGRELNEKLQKIIKLQKDLSENTLKDIIDKCSNFVEFQKHLNGGGE